MNLGKFSVSNPVLLNILWVAIFLLGILSFRRLPQELFSDISFSWVFIAVPYPGVGAEEIEKNVSIKIEDELSDISEIKKISSVSREGISFVQVEFDDGLSKRDFQRLYQDVRTEFDKVVLPQGTLDPVVDEFSTADFAPILSVILNGKADPETINKTAETLQKKLIDVDAVSNVQIVGNQEREVWIETDKEKLDAFGISLDEIANAIRYRNNNIPGGTIEAGNREYILQTIGEVGAINDFGSVIVRRRTGTGSITVADLAKINRGFAKSSYDARYNGNKAVVLEIAKSNDGNSIQVVNQCKSTIEEFKKTLPPGLTIDYFNDTSNYIRDILKTLSSNAVMGFVFLVLVLFIFLGLRNAILTAMAIPITFAFTFIFMEWYGESLNGNSLFALVLVLGMIVDHAIVIMENSYRYRQEGLGKYEAAIQGTNEVVKPVIAGTLTTIGAFLPLMLLPGIMGKFMRVIPLVVSLALVASTIEALLFLPVHFADWGGSVKEKDTGLIGRFRKGFGRLVSKMYRHRYLTVLVTIAIIILSAITLPFIKQDLFSGESFSYFFVNIKMPNGTPRQLTNEITNRFEQRLLPLIGNGEIEAVSSTVGYMLTDDDRLTQSNLAQITVAVIERSAGRKRPITTIMKEVEKKCSDIPGAESVVFNMLSNGPPVDKPVSFRLQGDDLSAMSSLADEYKQSLATYPELFNISDNYESGFPQLQIVVNQERAIELGLNAALIGKYIRDCFDGVQATTYYDHDEEIDVIVQFSEKDRASVDDVLNMNFPTMDGRMVPFSTICTMKRETGIFSIRRVDGKREITVSADTDAKNKKVLIKQIEKGIVDDFSTKYKDAYPGITVKIGGEFAEFNKLIGDILRLFWIGLFFIYIILGAQFKSYIQPFIILFAIPFAFVGCILFLFFSGTAISLVVLFAGVALVGICVNDSIVLISFINNLRRKGTDISEAIIKGTETRLRPIILTSVTTIGGLIPMALGLGGRSETWAPMASTIIFGLFFSTMGTLIVIPCIYGIFNDIAEKFGLKMKLEGE